MPGEFIYHGQVLRAEQNILHLFHMWRTEFLPSLRAAVSPALTAVFFSSWPLAAGLGFFLSYMGLLSSIS